MAKTEKYLYAVVSFDKWMSEYPVVFRTKSELVSHLGLKNTRLVDKWFKDSWIYLGLAKSIVTKLPIPKVKSKIRK